jgi:heavy metal translocating P-type ATPase
MNLNLIIAALSLSAIVLTVAFDIANHPSAIAQLPVLVALVGGGALLVFRLVRGLFAGQFGSDLLAGVSIVTSLVLGEYLAGSLVVLMLSGGEALEDYAMRRASAVLDALAKRMPCIAHRRNTVSMVDIAVQEVRAGDELIVLPHELCPVDGIVIEGHSAMDESYLTGEPYRISKTPGCEVISGAINGESPLVIRAAREAKDSRYVKIMQVMDETRQRRPRMRRIADTLGIIYTPVALLLAFAAWGFSDEPSRFLSVLVVATPCPLIIAIPVAILGAISWCAKRGIIIKDPLVLERAHRCEVLITDKTGTLTVGEPVLESMQTKGLSEDELLQYAASLEQYSRHPLAAPVLAKATQRNIVTLPVTDVSEIPGQGLSGMVQGKRVMITGRRSLEPALLEGFQAQSSGLECVVVLDWHVGGVLHFRDQARLDSRQFVSHLGPRHNFKDVILLSGDRDQEVQHLAAQMGITRVYAGCSPEDKVAITRDETTRAQTLFLGDGVNDAPALSAATVGVAFGPRSDITSEAAGAVILEPSLRKVDQLLHVSARLRAVALQSAVGGMVLSVIGMFSAGLGFLTPVWGAMVQEGIDLFAVLNALRAASMGSAESDDM